MKKDLLNIKIYPTRQEMGHSAGLEAEDAISRVIAEKNCCNIIFAAAPSQNEVLAALVASKRIDWSRVHAFHMDEYIGISADAPQGFANFLRTAIFDKVWPGKVEYLNCQADPTEEASRYAALLKQYPADIVIMGIGENGHIAFNDPPVADFHDTVLVKPVTLDQKCRNQQVHDGCFATLDQVPTTALTLTVPALIAPAKVLCIVPASTKAQAVYDTVNGPIAESCPASILRRHPDATLYLDADSSRLLSEV